MPKVKLSKDQPKRLSVPDIRWVIRNRTMPLYFSETMHESNIQEKLLTTTGDSFWDIGAWNGLYSLLLRRNFDEIVSFEPNPTSRRRIFLRSLLHGASLNIQPYCISNVDGRVKFGIAGSAQRGAIFSGSSESRLDTLPGRPSIRRVVEVPAITIDSFIKSNRVRHHSISLAKIDVEGSEFLVLDGARQFIEEGAIKRLVIEVHDWSRLVEMEQLLESFNYATERLIGAGFRHVFARLL